MICIFASELSILISRIALLKEINAISDCVLEKKKRFFDCT